MAGFLEADGERFGLLRPGLRILELGAGCGWLGLTVARNVHSLEELCMTEQVEGEGLGWLKHNVEKARADGIPLGQRVTTAACDWTWYPKFTPDKKQKEDEVEEATLKIQGEIQAIDRKIAAGVNPDVEEDAKPLASSSDEPEAMVKASGMKHIAETKWDLIIGSDLVYNSAGVNMLPAVLRALTKNGTTGMLRM